MRELDALLRPAGYRVAQDRRGYPEIQAARLQDVCEAGAQHLLREGVEPPFVLEDSGLFVDSLRGWPGVDSRHALETVGLDGLLRLLADGRPRTARFRSCLTLAEPGARRTRIRHFHGTCAGAIAAQPEGDAGFGFDPVFRPRHPSARGRTFAQMDTREKTAISHRGQAVRRLLVHLAKAANQ